MEMVFKDKDGNMHPVYELPDITHFHRGNWYIIDGYVYECLGEISSKKDRREGTIVNFLGRNEIIPYKDKTLMKLFSADNVKPRGYYEPASNDMDKIMEDYLQNYESGNNLVLQTQGSATSSGEVFIPEMRPDDDPFEKIIKCALRHMKIVLNDLKKNLEKPHILDNLRSALTGATKNMSITKFLLWCKILNLDWEIRVSDADNDVQNPIGEDIWISNNFTPWEDIKPATKGIFVVPLSEKDDPLKRVIKLVLDKKRINTKACEDRCASTHLVNNMKSALKHEQKTTMLYFVAWCELLDITYRITITEPSGVYFQVIGFDVYSNIDQSEMNDIMSGNGGSDGING